MKFYTSTLAPSPLANTFRDGLKYHRHEGKSGKIWLVADTPNAGDHIYTENGRGFYGDVVRFPLAADGEVALKGPWHSSPSDLYDDTGIDLRAKCLTFFVVATEREYDQRIMEYIYSGILHRDTDWQIGRRGHGWDVAQEHANRLGAAVHLFGAFSGRRTFQRVEPEPEYARYVVQTRTRERVEWSAVAGFTDLKDAAWRARREGLGSTESRIVERATGNVVEAKNA